MTHSVIHFVDSRSFGGIETHILHLDAALRGAGIDSSICLWNDYGNHPVFGPARANGADVWTCNGNIRELIAGVSEREALIHAHGYKASLIAKALSVTTIAPAVVTFHAGDVGKGLVRLYTMLDRATRVIPSAAVSAPVAARYGASQLVRNFVPLPIRRRNTGWQRAAFVGRLSAEKGPDLFVEAAAQMPDIEFLVIGDGPMRECLEARATPNVKFLGQRNMADLWDSIDVLCMPSRAEGLPMAALEALSRGIPLIASPVGALPKLLEGNRTGWLLDDANADALAGALRAWRNAPECVLEAISVAGRILVRDNYTPEACLTDVLSLYERAVRKQPALALAM